MRVLIATVTAGAGHLQAAAALEEAWRALRPRDNLQKIDVLDYTPRLYRKVYIESYVQLVEHAPELWGRVFSKTDDPVLVRKTTRVRRALAHSERTKVHPLLQKVPARGGVLHTLHAPGDFS